MKKSSLFVFFFATFISVNAQSKCDACRGYGKFACNTCFGVGTTVQLVYNPYYGSYMYVSQICPTCQGYLYVLCRKCSGTGRSDNGKKRKTSNPSFGSAIYKECTLCNCKDYKGPHGDSYCQCKHKRREHVLRTYN